MAQSRKPTPNTAPRAAKPEANSALVSAEWRGPLPPPAVLREFDGIVENGAERIMRMAEAEQAHRHNTESTDLIQHAQALKRAQWSAVAVSVLAIAGAIATAMAGVHWSVPVALVSVPIASIVKALMASRPR